MMVVSRTDGNLAFHYTLVDQVVDFLISIGLKPLIQYSFMPRELAADPNKTVCYSPFITSPPRAMSEWELLVEDLHAICWNVTASQKYAPGSSASGMNR